MAEDFLEEIYRQSDGLQQLQDTVKYTRSMMLEEAFEKWNGVTDVLTGLARDTAETDIGAAKALMDAAGAASEKWGDPAAFSAETERAVIPAYKACLKYKACIDVEDGRYRLKSADSGYLTVFDSEQGIWLHDDHDPMAAASELARSLYKPGMEEFHIFGCGLGYEAFQIYLYSEKSVKIFIYESDRKIVDMAFAYGVMDRIDPDMLNIVPGKDMKTLKSCFLKMTENKNTGSYISFWEAAEYSKTDGGELMQERMVRDGERSLEHLWEINAKKNEKRADLDFDTLKGRLEADEWIVVAAGPSLDDNMEYLKENAGKIRIAAVETVLKKLLAAGIKPDVVTVADPKEAITRYLNGIEVETTGIPLIAGRLTGWKYTHMYKGEVCLITEGADAARITGKDGIWNVGGTVSSLAIEAAVRLGAKRVYAVGLDLAYPDGKLYASGSDNDNKDKGDGEEWVASNSGGRVQTSPTFRFFKEQIEQQIARYPQVKFINLSKGGALIKGMRPGRREYE